MSLLLDTVPALQCMMALLCATITILMIVVCTHKGKQGILYTMLAVLISDLYLIPYRYTEYANFFY